MRVLFKDGYICIFPKKHLFINIGQKVQKLSLTEIQRSELKNVSIDLNNCRVALVCQNNISVILQFSNDLTASIFTWEFQKMLRGDFWEFTIGD